MNISFTENHAYDFDRGAVSFEAYVDHQRVICKITDEALQDHFDNSAQPMDAYTRNRDAIESLAIDLIERDGVIPTSPFIIRSKDHIPSERRTY